MTKLSIVFFIVGLIVFTTMATFDKNDFQSYLWGHIYDVWQKTSITMFVYIGWDLSRKMYKNLLKPLFFICLLRIILSILSWILGVDFNDYRIIGIIFLICCIYVLYATRNVRS